MGGTVEIKKAPALPFIMSTTTPHHGNLPINPYWPIPRKRATHAEPHLYRCQWPSVEPLVTARGDNSAICKPRPYEPIDPHPHRNVPVDLTGPG